MDIAVVIPAYNAASTIHRAVTTAVDQNPPPAEVIVVDDASIDDTAELAAKVGARVLRRAENGGPGAALNDAVRATAADWVCIQGADDYWLPGRLRAVRATIDSTGADIVTTDAWVEDPRSGRRVRYYRPVDGARWAAHGQRMAILRSNFIFGSAAVRRDLWLANGVTHKPESRVCEDWPRWVRLLLAGARAALFDEPLAVYTLTYGSRSASAQRLLNCFRAAMTEGLTHPGATEEERQFAAWQLALAHRQQRLLAMRTNVWFGRRSPSSAMSVLLSPGERRRHRAEAALALVAPRLARLMMKHDPTAR